MSECIEAPDLQEAFTNASAEWQAARAQLEQAQGALKLAEVAGMKATAAANGGAGDPVALMRAERDANTALTAARRIVGITEQKVAAKLKAKDAAWAQTFRPVHDEGRRRRMAACVRADAARRELDAADLDFQHATALIHKARNGRCTATAGMDGAMFNTPVQTAADEAALWMGR